ncbi:MAG: acyltransferase family protein, partial [Anaerolineae bacterium]
MRDSYTSDETLGVSGNPKGLAPHRTALGYLPGLDGLRALAVLAVLLYHADLHWAQGGFLGVEVFFVISGYLITALLLAEWRTQGRIDLPRFWFRRARRLLPALLVLIGAGLAYAVLFLPAEVATLRGDAAAALLYVTNWYYILGQKSYFEFVGRPSLFQHLWSLAVEEQFYLIWPVLLTLLVRLFKPRRAQWVILGGALFSTLLMALLYQPDLDPSRVYYGTDTRAAGLLLGAALAFAWRPWEQAAAPSGAGTLVRSLLLDLTGLAGLAALGWACLQVNEFDPFLYQGGFALISLATAIVIAVAVHPRAHLGRRLLSLRPLVWIGERSYGIYLWHWPICALTRPQLDVSLDALPLLVIRFGLTFVLAELSYRYIEMPIRRGALGKAWQDLTQAHGKRRWELALKGLASSSAIVLSVVVLGQSVVSAHAPAVPAYLADLETTPTPMVATPSVVARSSTSQPSPTVSIKVNPTTQPTRTPTESDGPIRMIDRPASLTATPAITATMASTLTVTAIGDSVMLKAEAELQRAIPGIDVDAAIGRQPWVVNDLLVVRQDAGTLAPIVVIHVGNNGRFTPTQFDKIMATLAAAHRVIFINNKVPRDWQDINNKDLAAGVKRYANAVLIDWNAASKDHPEYFWDDGIHTRPAGTEVYAALIAQAVG